MYNYFGDDSVNKIYKRETYLKKIRGFYNDSEMIKVITGIKAFLRT